MEVCFTSRTEASQIYVPQINWLLAAAVIALVLGFKSSDALAGAYGVAVSTTMLVTTLLVSVVAHRIWRWSWATTISVGVIFFLIDAAFFSANIAKVLEGGYIPLIAGALVFAVMTTWHKGRAKLLERIDAESTPLVEFWEKMHCENMARVPGTAVYLTSRGDRVPASMTLNVKHNKCLHEHVVLLTVITEKIPRVPLSRRVSTETLEHGFSKLTLRYGFAEAPNVPRTMRRAIDRGIDLGFQMNGKGVSYFVGRAIPIASDKPDLPAWREPIFMFLTRNSTSASNFFAIPPEAVVELGTHVEM
jgi:KUP system potassium uptake protein